MEHSTFTVRAADGTPLHVNRWLPEGTPRAVVQVAHGMAEHSDRYERFAEALTGAGFAVYAADHRGHKGTAGTHDAEGYWADHDGWETVVDDLAAVTAAARGEQPGLPVVLFGHSMGSFLSRAYAAKHAGAEGDRDAIAGLVLSGTAGDPGPLGVVVRSVQRGLQAESHGLRLAVAGPGRSRQVRR
jgi:alpha-beta hydrolase superfamily lysophospholipase